MNSGKELILSTKKFASENRFKSWFHTLVMLCILFVMLYGMLFVPYLLIRLCCSIVFGLVMVRGFVIYHDFLHHSIFYKSIPAKIIFTLYGLFMLAPTSIWKRSHDYHHNHNCKLFSAGIGSYPIMTIENYQASTKEERRQYLASRHPLTIAFGYITMFIIGMCWNSFISNPKKHWDSLLALVLHFTAIVFLFFYFGITGVVLTIIIPFFLSLMIGSYLFYVQHNFPGVSFRDKKEWTYPQAALESSSFLKMHPVLHWITGNIGYHHVHHLNSRIPFYRLKETMDYFPALQKAKTTTPRFKDI
jgi:omega-6 fatty acid desaturase (delta-12 desaturase)